MWFGGFANQLFVNENELSHLPNIKKLAKDFDIFQNSPYYGEFNQKKSITYGEVRDLLAEIAVLLKKTL